VVRYEPGEHPSAREISQHPLSGVNPIDKVRGAKSLDEQPDDIWRLNFVRLYQHMSLD
jgi:hypothetical protein